MMSMSKLLDRIRNLIALPFLIFALPFVLIAMLFYVYEEVETYDLD